MPWITNHKQKIKEKSTKSSRSSSKVVGLGLADLREFPTLIANGQDISPGREIENYQVKTATTSPRVQWVQ